ncbi:glycosyltransferase family 2 protein [Gigaspora margarita]|uniref:Glycosyltransferase family 2 protein n=1 Tax=Gigaspora margarita TaxID=4874 RepID=A0A8H3XCD0_GIGMA|nr:glycosyltransferase family 2 protein [Gigaspora margarita]
MRRHGTRNFYCIIIIFLYISLCRIISSEFQVYELKTYNDGTILVHLVSDAESTELNCRKPILYFKILHPNGIIDSINLNVTGIIPDFNFCKTRIGNVYDNYIKVHPLTRGTIFIMYINSTDFSSASVYGLLISWKGEIISSTFLKEAIFQNKIVLSPGSLYFPRNRDITSFIYVTSQPDTSDIIWSLFTLPIPTNNRTINLIREGFIKNDGGSFVNFVAFLTAAGDYCLVVARSYTSNTSNTLSSTPMLDITLQIHLKVEAYFIYTIETENTVPSIIYMSAIENLNVFAMNCDIEYSGLGNMCQLYFVNGLGVSTFPFTLSIVFHSSGSVGTAVSNDLELDIKATDYLVLDPLYYQGDLLTIHRPQETGNFIYGYIINATGHVVSNWTIPQPLQTNSTGNIYGILPDNIITYAMQNGVSNWTLNFEKLPEFTMIDDNGYFNPQINSTSPPINGTIPIRTNEIIINYKQAVTLSDGNISVFQLQDVYGDSLLRQTYSGNSGYCNVTADSLTIKCYILESTFNQQNTEYYVLVEPNFVRLNSTEEPLLGIEKLVWKFKSNMTVTESYSATIQSIIRLDTLASARFENLTTDGKVEFVNQLNHELAVCVPVDAKRFYSEAAYQYDPSIVEKRILLPLTIFNAPINSSMIENSTDVFGDLNVLIRNSNLTLISRMNKTKSLDPSFGIIRARKYT